MSSDQPPFLKLKLITKLIFELSFSQCFIQCLGFKVCITKSSHTIERVTLEICNVITDMFEMCRSLFESQTKRQNLSFLNLFFFFAETIQWLGFEFCVINSSHSFKEIIVKPKLYARCQT